MKRWIPLAAFLVIAMGGIAFSQSSGVGWLSYDTVGNLRVSLGTAGLAAGSATGPGWLKYDTSGNLLVSVSGGVSCPANTVVLATLVVTNGVVTHC